MSQAVRSFFDGCLFVSRFCDVDILACSKDRTGTRGTENDDLSAVRCVRSNQGPRTNGQIGASSLSHSVGRFSLYIMFDNILSMGGRWLDKNGRGVVKIWRR